MLVATAEQDRGLFYLLPAELEGEPSLADAGFSGQ